MPCRQCDLGFESAAKNAQIASVRETCRNSRSQEDVGSLCGGRCHAQCQLPGANETLLSLADAVALGMVLASPFSISVIVVTWKFYRASNTNLQKAVATLIAIEKTRYPSERLKTFSKDEFSCEEAAGREWGGVASWLADLALMVPSAASGPLCRRLLLQACPVRVKTMDQ